MTTIDLLLVGDAGDGPLEEILEVESRDEIWRLFGGYSYEQTTLLSGATSYSLARTPWADQVQPLSADSDGTLIPLSLFEFSPSGALLSFSAPGAATPAIFQYVPLPGGRSLLKGLLAADAIGVHTHVLRLGSGAQAASSLPSGGFQFWAQYPGDRYNGTTIVVDATGGVTVTPAAGTGRIWRYRPTSDNDLRNSLSQDRARGRESVYLTGTGSAASLTVPAGTYRLSGGVNGSFTASGFMQFLQDYDLSGVDVVCPVGLLTTELSGAGVWSWMNDQDYPTLLVAQAPASGDALSGMVNTCRYLASVGFRTTYDSGLRRARQDDAAPLVAAIIAAHRFGVTLAALPHSPTLPAFGPAALSAVASGGHIAAYRSISKGPALWHAVTGDQRWSVATVRAFQEIARALYTVLEPILGQHHVDLQGLTELLSEALTGVTGSRKIQFKLELAGDRLYCDLSFQPYGEVRTVQAQLSLGAIGAGPALEPTL